MKEQMPLLLPVVVNMVRYFLFAGIPFLIFYILFPGFFSKNKIQTRLAKSKDFTREILHSMQTTFILAGVAMLILRTPLRDFTLFYKNIDDYPVWWIPLSIVLALVVHDTYFYWMHRTAHLPGLYKQVHLLHHKSVNPSPWASYSFQFTEGILEAMIIPIILVIIPMHPIALILFGLLGFIFNVYGHLGYEIAPKWFRYSFLFEILNTSTHHNLHHAKFHGNYGLYFRYWDRILKTEHPDYVKTYDEIQERRFGNEERGNFSVKPLLTMLLLLGLGFAFMSARSHDSIEGTWKDTKTGGVIKIYEEDGLFFGQLIGADNPEDQQKIASYEKIILLKDFERKSDTEYCCGTIYQPKEKRTIQAKLILEDQQTLRVNGTYAGFTGTRVWKRE